MEATIEMRLAAAEEHGREQAQRIDELAALSAHLNAATARWLELAWEVCTAGDLVDDPARFLAFRCGVTTGEARELLRVAEALQELPVLRAAFARGELTWSKVRALSRVATPATEEGLVRLAGALTASQLVRALRAFARVTADAARRAQELEFVSYRFADDGSLLLRARLSAEDGVVVVKALEAARERVYRRRREEGSVGDPTAGGYSATDGVPQLDAPRPPQVEALLDVAETSLAAPEPCEGLGRPRLVVHVDADALVAGAAGCCELGDGPQISADTARRLGCDADVVARIEREGLPLSVGRSRRSVPPALRRLLEARDRHTCRFPGCDRRHRLQAHHLRHWADGGETSLDNLLLLCTHHHRLVHEGGYTTEHDDEGAIRFRNRHGVLHPRAPSRPPPGSAGALVHDNDRHGLEIGPRTNRHGYGERLDLDLTLAHMLTTIAPAMTAERG